MPEAKRVWRSGVRFDCPDCGKLLRDDKAHAEEIADGRSCGGTLQLVGQGERIVEHAQWFRCLDCRKLFMNRRGELVETKERSGFAEFA